MPLGDILNKGPDVEVHRDRVVPLEPRPPESILLVEALAAILRVDRNNPAPRVLRDLEKVPEREVQHFCPQAFPLIIPTGRQPRYLECRDGAIGIIPKSIVRVDRTDSDGICEQREITNDITGFHYEKMGYRCPLGLVCISVFPKISGELTVGRNEARGFMFEGEPLDSEPNPFTFVLHVPLPFRRHASAFPLLVVYTLDSSDIPRSQ